MSELYDAEYDAEYDVILHTVPCVDVLQYPLSSTVPSVSEIRTKENGKYVEVVLGQKHAGAREIRMKGCAAQTINEYYVLCIDGRKITGRKVQSIVQLRPVLDDTQETIAKTSKKDAVRIYALNETQEEREARAKNPNHMVCRIEKEKWTVRYTEEDNKHTEHNERANNTIEQSADTNNSAQGTNAQCEEGKKTTTAEDAVRRVVYNARVVNTSALQEILADVHVSVIYRVLDEMTETVAGRYILKAEYYNTMQDTYRRIVERMKKGNGSIEIEYKEAANPDEEYMYVLQQIAHKEKHKYVLKGYNERVE